MTVIKLFTIIVVSNREILSFSTSRDLGRVYKFSGLSDEVIEIPIIWKLSETGEESCTIS